MHKLRFRQIHLDAHTSGALENIGKKFDPKEWQQMLLDANVNSVTCFSKCHHGWSYHDTKVGRKHPHLKRNLLREQIDTFKQADINVPVYLSAGLDDVMAYEHPEWREISPEGAYQGWNGSPLVAGFRKMCFNSPYLDYLCEQIEEAVKLFPEADGIFLDIISQGQCCCKYCMDLMLKKGLDPESEQDRKKCAQIAIDSYYKRTTASCRVNDKNMPVFHNSGHITVGKRDILKYFSHLELESLPTGGWGYDHFPMSAKYCQNLKHDFLGMTGKFHTTWGEYGGYKHPNALLYECSAMIAYGAKCSVGDQFHPLGYADKSTYNLIGKAYRSVREKEPWCDNVQSVADVGLLSSIAVNKSHQMDSPADTGAGRILLESHITFDFLDTQMDFSPYKLLILPDDLRLEGEVLEKVQSYVGSGGKLLLTGTAGVNQTGDGFLFDVGAEYHGINPHCPDYVLPIKGLRPDWIDFPLVMYESSCRVKATTGQSLGDVYDTYFNRNYRHYSSHQHTPHKETPSGYDCGVTHGAVTYLAHPVFTIYRGTGAVSYKQYVQNVINQILTEKTIETNLPSTSRVSLMNQTKQKRFVLHLLYANTLNRGGELKLSGGTLSGALKGVEVIEELLPLHNTSVKLRLPRKVSQVTSQPDNQPIEFTQADGVIEFNIDEFTCHKMLELKY